eukprot:TRINITY_DN5160_c0_g1_i2.p1 TRINITY_DN5160_c0_g1~~TRINITY_DN5160_c0_g1_i2.p1  ORF type:complete len:144 (-),score=23.81 TRINITY_DN5160_c0_g1_i2:78-509(-)
MLPGITAHIWPAAVQSYPVVVCCTHIATDKANAVIAVQDVAMWMREAGIAHTEPWMSNRTTVHIQPCYVDVTATAQQGASENVNLETASAPAVDWKQQFATELDRHSVRNLFEVDCIQHPESVEESFAALLKMIEHMPDATTL